MRPAPATPRLSPHVERYRSPDATAMSGSDEDDAPAYGALLKSGCARHRPRRGSPCIWSVIPGYRLLRLKPFSVLACTWIGPGTAVSRRRPARGDFPAISAPGQHPVCSGSSRSPFWPAPGSARPRLCPGGALREVISPQFQPSNNTLSAAARPEVFFESGRADEW